MIDSMRSYSASKRVTMAKIMRDAGIGAAEGLAAFRAGDYGHAVDCLLPIRYGIYPIGGSHADYLIWVGRQQMGTTPPPPPLDVPGSPAPGPSEHHGTHADTGL